MKIQSPAKINLFLHITGKRDDGYHNLSSLMCCVSLYDTVVIDITGTGIAVTCNSSEVPENEGNLAWRAADLFFKSFKQMTGNKGTGVKITIDKNIPVAAGLGGGSSNAAAIFLGLNRYFGNPFAENELMDMGLKIGADVPFFIFQQPALASGIGEQLKPYYGIKKQPVMLICPMINVSTAEVYKNLDLGLTKCEKKLKRILLSKQVFDPDRHLCNDLETVTELRFPEIASIKDALIDNGAKGALMSGSGPSVFGLFTQESIINKAHRVLMQNKKWRVFSAELLINTGYRILDT